MTTHTLRINAAQLAGGKFAEALPFKDEVEFLQSKIAPLMSEADGFFSAADIDTFAAYFQQYGGWWKTTEGRTAPNTEHVLDGVVSGSEAEFAGEGEFYFVPFFKPSQTLGLLCPKGFRILNRFLVHFLIFFLINMRILREFRFDCYELIQKILHET